MSKRVAGIALGVFLFLTNSARAQTSTDINNLLKKSKLVDTGRQVNTTVNRDLTTISTYCNPRATNQDCKITSLLMMKELNQHFKNIHRIRVLFFDPEHPSEYREVEIREGDALLVDSGKPLPEVLSQIDVTKNKVSKPSTPVSSNQNSRMTYAKTNAEQSKSNQPLISRAQSGYTNFTSPDGDATMLYPNDWQLGSEPAALIKAATVSGNSSASIILYRHPMPGFSVEDIVKAHEFDLQAKFKDYKKVNQKPVNCGALPGIYLEGNVKLPNGVLAVERTAFLKGTSHLYSLTLNSVGESDADSNRLFQTMFSSLSIRE